MGDKKESKGLGGKQLVFEAPIPKFLMNMVGKEKVQAALAKEREEKRIEEMGDREDDDNPLIDADPAMLEEYKKQQELIKLQEEALEAERQYKEEQILKRQAQQKSKFHTNEQTTHLFQVRKKLDEETKEKESENAAVPFKKRKRNEVGIKADDIEEEEEQKGKPSDPKRPKLDEKGKGKEQTPSAPKPALNNKKLLSFVDAEEEDDS